MDQTSILGVPSVSFSGCSSIARTILSQEKTRPYFPLNPGSLIGIFIMVFKIIPT